MTIQERADAYIGHPREVDEGYEVSMRRNAYYDGCTAIMQEIMEKVTALRDNYIRQLEVPREHKNAIHHIQGKLEAAEMIREIIMNI